MPRKRKNFCQSDLQQLEFYEPTVKKIHLALLHGNWERAHALLDEAEQLRMDPGSAELSLDSPLGQTKLENDPRLLNSLEDYGIATIGELLNASEIQLAGIPGLGVKRIDYLRELVGKLAGRMRQLPDGILNQESNESHE
jgi:DNA-directed RNA polymerase alpha subunit